MFIVWVFRADWRIPAIGAGLMILATLVVGNVYPWAVQRFQVSPNERALEQPFIQHNIDATREAFGIADVKEERSEEHTSELQSRGQLVCRLLLEKQSPIPGTARRRNA